MLRRSLCKFLAQIANTSLNVSWFGIGTFCGSKPLILSARAFAPFSVSAPSAKRVRIFAKNSPAAFFVKVSAIIENGSGSPSFFWIHASAINRDVSENVLPEPAEAETFSLAKYFF